MSCSVIINKILNKPFLKNIVLLASGSLISILITVICSPLTSRIYRPDQIGLFSYLLSIIQLFWPVMNLRYDMAIVSEEKETNIFPLIKLSFLISFLLTIVISILFGIFIYFSRDYHAYIYLLPLIFIQLITYGITNVLTSYNNRKKEYKTLSIVQVIRAAFQNILPVVVGIMNPSILGLFIPYTIGQLLGLNSQFKPLKPYFHEILHVSKKRVLDVAKIHIKQPLFSSPALFANTLSFTSILLFMENLFDLSVVGHYSLATRVLNLPLLILSGNVSKVFFEEASREYDQNGVFHNTFIKTTKFLLTVAIPVLILLLILPSSVYGKIFGANWISIGKYLKILAPMYVIRLIVSTLTPGILIVKKQNYELLLQLLFLLTSIIPYIIVKKFALTAEFFLSTTSLLKSASYLLYFVLIFKFSRIKRAD